MGVSITRSVPNSCTSPTRVLKGWPASAMSSPMMKTRGSRRISSAMASLTASPYVSSRSPMSVSFTIGWRYSITRSARARIDDGTARPIRRAVVMLIVSEIRLTCSIGTLPASAPLSTLSTNLGPRSPRSPGGADLVERGRQLAGAPRQVTGDGGADPAGPVLGHLVLRELARVLRVREQRDLGGLRHQLLEHLDALGRELERHERDAGHVAPGLGQAVREARRDRIATVREHHRDAGGDRLGVVHRGAARDQHVDALGHQLVDQPGEPREVPVREARDQHVALALDVPQLPESLAEVRQAHVRLADVGEPADAGGTARALGPGGRGAQGHQPRDQGEHGPARRRSPLPEPDPHHDASPLRRTFVVAAGCLSYPKSLPSAWPRLYCAATKPPEGIPT